LALSRGMSYFLLPVCLKAGTFSAILCSMCPKSLVLAVMNVLMVSLAFLSLNLTSSTFCMGGLFGTGYLGYWKVGSPKHSPPILV